MGLRALAAQLTGSGVELVTAVVAGAAAATPITVTGVKPGDQIQSVVERDGASALFVADRTSVTVVSAADAITITPSTAANEITVSYWSV